MPKNERPGIFFRLFPDFLGNPLTYSTKDYLLPANLPLLAEYITLPFLGAFCDNNYGIIFAVQLVIGNFFTNLVNIKNNLRY